MALNEMIAQGAQFKMPDPLEQYGRIAQIQQAQNQNALAQYQISSAQRADETNTNFLRELRAAGDDPAKQRQALLNAGKVEDVSKFDLSALTRQKTQGDIQKLNRDDFTERLQDINNNSSKENVLAHLQDIKASASYSPEFKALATVKLTDLAFMSDEDRAKVTKFSGMTGAQKLTANKPNIAPINIKDFTPESVQAYLKSLDTGSLVAVAPKAANVYAPIDPSKYTQDSLKAYGLSGQVSDLVPLPAKAANAFAPINVKDFTPESLRAFLASQNPADLVAAPSKATNVYAPINPKDYTPESLKAYGLSGEVSDLTPVAAKAEKPTSLINQIDASKFTPASVAKFATSQNYADLEPIAAKTDKPASLVNQIDASKFTPSSVSAFSSSGGDYSLLVPVVSATKADRTIANIDPAKYTSASVEKYSVSGNYGDLKLLPEKAGGGGTAAPKAPSGFRFTPTGDLEPIPGGPSALGLTPKEIQKREASLPQARQAVKTVSNTMSVIGQTVDSLLANPSGIDGITGLVYGITPAITGPARKAKAELEQLKNLAFVQGITELRAASKTGAGVGNVSNREGDRFENLKATLDRQQDKNDLIAALKKLKQQAELTSQFMSEAFDETYQYKFNTPQSPNAPAAPASNITQQRQDANAAIAKGAPAAAVRQRFKQNTGQEL